MPTDHTRFKLAFLIGWTICAAAGSSARAADDPAAAPPEPKALRFARQDLVRWTDRAKVLTDAAAQSAAALEAATKVVADAKGAQVAADKALADATAALVATQQAQAAADKGLADARELLKKTETEKKDDAEALKVAQAAVEVAQKNAEAAARKVTEAIEAKKQAEAGKAAADKKVPEVEAAIKPATDAKAAADKVSAEGQAQLKAFQDRVTVIEKATPKADPAATRLLQTITHDRPVMSCRFEARGDFVVVGAQDNNLHRFDLVTASAQHFKGHKSWLGTLALMPPAGAVTVTGGHEGQLIWWNDLEKSPVPARAISAHKGYIRAVAISPDGQLIATGGNDNLVKVWSAADGTLVKELAGHGRHVYHIAFHPSGKFLVSGDLMGILKQWEVGSWNMVRELDGKILSKFDTGFQADVGGIRSLDFSPDGKLLAAAGITEVSNAFAGIGVPAVVLFDWESGKQVKLLKPKDAIQGSVWGVRFHPSGEFLIGAGGGGAGAMWFWKPDDEKSFVDFKLPAVAYDLALHPDELRLAVALFDKTIRIYDLSPKLEVAAAPAAK